MEKRIPLAYNRPFGTSGNTSHLKLCEERMSGFQMYSAKCSAIDISLEILEF